MQLPGSAILGRLPHAEQQPADGDRSDHGHYRVLLHGPQKALPARAAHVGHRLVKGRLGCQPCLDGGGSPANL